MPGHTKGGGGGSFRRGSYFGSFPNGVVRSAGGGMEAKSQHTQGQRVVHAAPAPPIEELHRMHPSRNTSHRRGSFFGSFPAAGLAAKEHVKGSTDDEVNSVLARVLGDQARDKKERAAARRRQASSDALRAAHKSPRGRPEYYAENARPAEVVLTLIRRELNRRCIVADALFSRMRHKHEGVEKVRALQFGQGLRACGIDISPTEADAIFALVDVSTRGWISHADLDNFMAQLGVGFWATVGGQGCVDRLAERGRTDESSAVASEESSALRAAHRVWSSGAHSSATARAQGLRGKAAIGHETAWHIMHMVQQCGLRSLRDVFAPRQQSPRGSNGASAAAESKRSAEARAASCRITFEELAVRLRAADIDTTLYERECLWHVATPREDINRSPTMDWREIGAVIERDTHVMRKRIRAAAYRSGGCDLQTLFQLVDVDGNGTIDCQEFAEMIRRRGVAQNTGHAVSEIEVRFVFAAIDYDGDGVITYSEFLTWMAAEDSAVRAAEAAEAAAAERAAHYREFGEHAPSAAEMAAAPTVEARCAKGATFRRGMFSSSPTVAEHVAGRRGAGARGSPFAPPPPPPPPSPPSDAPPELPCVAIPAVNYGAMGLSVEAYEAEVAEQAKRAAFWAVAPAPSASTSSTAVAEERVAAAHHARAEADHARDLERFATSTSMEALLTGDQSPPLLRRAPGSASAVAPSEPAFPLVALGGSGGGGSSYARALRFDQWGVAPRGAAAGAAASSSPGARDARNFDDADPRAALRSVDTFVSAQLESDVAAVLANIAML